MSGSSDAIKVCPTDNATRVIAQLGSPCTALDSNSTVARELQACLESAELVATPPLTNCGLTANPLVAGGNTFYIVPGGEGTALVILNVCSSIAQTITTSATATALSKSNSSCLGGVSTSWDSANGPSTEIFTANQCDNLYVVLSYSAHCSGTVGTLIGTVTITFTSNTGCVYQLTLNIEVSLWGLTVTNTCTLQRFPVQSINDESGWEYAPIDTPCPDVNPNDECDGVPAICGPFMWGILNYGLPEGYGSATLTIENYHKTCGSSKNGIVTVGPDIVGICCDEENNCTDPCKVTITDITLDPVYNNYGYLTIGIKTPSANGYNWAYDVGPYETSNVNNTVIITVTDTHGITQSAILTGNLLYYLCGG